MQPFAAYLLYNALKFHFAGSYDYFKYEGKLPHLATRAKEEQFLRNRQKFFFATLGRHEDPEGLCVSNMIRKPKIYVADLLQPAAQDVWLAWQRRNQSLSYTFSQELKKLDADQLLKLKPSGMPYLLDRYIAGEISPETVVIIDSFGKVLDGWSQLDHPLIQQYIPSLLKYRPFIKFDKSRAKAALKQLAESK